MRIALAACFLALSVAGFAQPFSRLWIKTTSRPLTDNYADLVIDTAGNSFVCGSSVNPATSRYEMLVVKFDKTGIKLWEKTFPGTSGHTVAQAIALDPNGHVVVAGQTQWAPPADGQARVIKVSAAGVLLWDHVTTATNGSYWYDVAVDRLGEVSTTGYLNNASKIMRTSHFLSNGTLAWSRDYAYPGLTAADQSGRYILVDNDQNIYVCGVNNGFPGRTYNTIVKYSRTSTQLWMKRKGNGYRDYPRGFVRLPDSRLVMTCDTTLPSSTMAQVGTTVFSQDGIELNHDLRSDAPVSVRSLAEDRNNNFFVATQANGSGPYCMLVSFASNYYTTQFHGFGDPDVRTVAGGYGGDFYVGSIPLGSGPRPARIQAFHAPGDFDATYPSWTDTIYGSSANGQSPYAIPQKMVCDSKGDLYVIFNASGANVQDGLIVKYELGPVARSNQFDVTAGQLFTSPTPGILFDDLQVGQSAVSLQQQAQRGTVTMSANGNFTYMPGPNFTGSDFFIYKVTRTNGTTVMTSTAQVQLR